MSCVVTFLASTEHNSSSGDCLPAPSLLPNTLLERFMFPQSSFHSSAAKERERGLLMSYLPGYRKKPRTNRYAQQRLGSTTRANLVVQNEVVPCWSVSTYMYFLMSANNIPRMRGTLLQHDYATTGKRGEHLLSTSSETLFLRSNAK